MPQSLAHVILHIVFSTKDRRPLIPAHLLATAHAFIADACRQAGSHPYRVGGVEDHVHIACTLPRTLTIAKLVQELKTASSTWIKNADDRCADFAWQLGYGAFSIGASQLDDLIGYVERQREHHTKRSYKEELVDFLRRYGVDFDERYLWE
jgi:REP element-mobilizing transposase RayT